MTVKSEGPPGLQRNAIGTAHIVFFVVAAAAPLTAVVGVSPAAFAFGNGPAVPAVFLLVGAFYLLFSAGFTAMSRFVATSSGFYAYVAQGLGRPLGVATAAMAISSYQSIIIASYALFGFFAHQMANDVLHFAMPWWVAALSLAGLVHLCGRRALSFSGNILAVCMAGEVLILLLLGIAILFTDGFGTAPMAAVPALGGPGLGIALVFVVASFIGFEATVIFGEEAREPARTIPRATYIAVSLIACFYAFCTWTITLHYHPDHIAAEAAAHPGDLYLGVIGLLLGPVFRAAADILLLTSIFACALSFHSTIARYIAAMAREGLCHNMLARIHPVHHSPHMAGFAQTVATVGMIIVFSIRQCDPYTELFAWAGAAASIGILAIQLLTSIAVANFFRRDARGVGFFRCGFGPIASAIGLTAALVLSIDNLPLLSGSNSPLVFYFPLIFVAIATAGLFIALRLRQRDPDRYRKLGHPD